MKRNTEQDIMNIFKLLEAGLDNKSIAEITGTSNTTAGIYCIILNSVKADEPVKKCYYESSKIAVVNAYKFCGKQMPEEKVEEKTETVVPEAKNAQNDALYMLKLLESIKSLDEHLMQIADADMPRNTEKITTAVEAMNINVDSDAIIKEMRSCANVLAMSIRETIRLSLGEIINIEKENRNTLTAIKNSVQRLEQKCK